MLWCFMMRLTFRRVVVWQLRTLNIGAALFLVKVEEEELQLAEPFTHTYRNSFCVPAGERSRRRENRNPSTKSDNAVSAKSFSSEEFPPTGSGGENKS